MIVDGRWLVDQQILDQWVETCDDSTQLTHNCAVNLKERAR